MPEIRLVDHYHTVRRGNPWNSRHAVTARAEARRMLAQARTEGMDLELRLGPEEREETVKARYRAAARHEQCSVRFVSAVRRSYRDRWGKEQREASVLLVVVS